MNVSCVSKRFAHVKGTRNLQVSKENVLSKGRGGVCPCGHQGKFEFTLRTAKGRGESCAKALGQAGERRGREGTGGGEAEGAVATEDKWALTWLVWLSA